MIRHDVSLWLIRYNRRIVVTRIMNGMEYYTVGIPLCRDKNFEKFAKPRFDSGRFHCTIVKNLPPFLLILNGYCLSH